MNRVPSKNTAASPYDAEFRLIRPLRRNEQAQQEQTAPVRPNTSSPSYFIPQIAIYTIGLSFNFSLITSTAQSGYRRT
jgi:hypothetical protein